MKKQNKKIKAKVKALIMLSGGLDSRLACKIMQQQKGIDVTALFFVLPFGAGCCNEHCAFNFAQSQGIKLMVVDCTKGKLLQEYISMIKQPEHGHGSGLNPCIDCRIFMFKKAKEIMEKQGKEGFDIIVTGEVLNERPMSQNKRAMDIIENETGLKGKLLRPLSAKLLPETQLEKSGKLDREKFFDIQGRQRKRQIELAKKYKINYPNPAGGCLLCEKEFVKKLKPLLQQSMNEHDIDLVKIGRHFENNKIILGRNQEENDRLENLKKQKGAKGILLIPKEPGPTAFVKKKDKNENKKLISKAKMLIQKYSKHKIKTILQQ